MKFLGLKISNNYFHGKLTYSPYISFKLLEINTVLSLNFEVKGKTTYLHLFLYRFWEGTVIFLVFVHENTLI